MGHRLWGNFNLVDPLEVRSLGLVRLRLLMGASCTVGKARDEFDRM